MYMHIYIPEWAVSDLFRGVYPGVRFEAHYSCISHGLRSLIFLWVCVPRHEPSELFLGVLWKCQVYSQPRGVFPRMWGLFFDCGCVLQDLRSLICLWVYVSGCKVSLLCVGAFLRWGVCSVFAFLSQYLFLISLCVFVKDVRCLLFVVICTSLWRPYPVCG